MASSEAQPTQVTSDSPECGALSLADGQKCEAKAISADGQFCGFHAKQCFGRSEVESCHYFSSFSSWVKATKDSDKVEAKFRPHYGNNNCQALPWKLWTQSHLC